MKLYQRSPKRFKLQKIADIAIPAIGASLWLRRGRLCLEVKGKKEYDFFILLTKDETRIVNQALKKDEIETENQEVLKQLKGD